MLLKLTRRKGSPFWWITGTVDGRRIRESTHRTEKEKAAQVLGRRQEELHRAAIYGPQAVKSWGHAIASYSQVENPKGGTAVLLERITEHFGQILLKDITQERVDQAVRALCRPGAAPATKLRNVIVPIQAVMNHAARRGWCQRPLFEKPKGATGVKRTRWLTPEEWVRLEAAAAPHLRPLLVFLIGTGSRLSEALELEWSDVDLPHGRARTWQKQQNERTLELPPSVVAALANLSHREGAVFLTDDRKRYRDTERTSGGQIATAFNGACRRAGLKGVTPHTLRHSWASWRYAYHRDPMRLRDEGGWSTIAQVERYAKLVPETMLPGIMDAWALGTISAQPETRTAKKA